MVHASGRSANASSHPRTIVAAFRIRPVGRRKILGRSFFFLFLFLWSGFWLFKPIRSFGVSLVLSVRLRTKQNLTSLLFEPHMAGQFLRLFYICPCAWLSISTSQGGWSEFLFLTGFPLLTQSPPPRIGFAHIFTLPFATVESPEFEQICVKLEDQTCWAPDFGSFFLSFFGSSSCTFAAPLLFIYILPVLHGRPIREAQEGWIEFSVALEGGPALFIPLGIWG